MWSIVCELIYYALYPLLYYFTRFVGWVKLLILSIIASYALVLGLGSDEYGNAHIYGPYLNWIVGLPAWLLGCVLAQKYRTSWNIGSIWPWRITTAVLASTLYWATINTSVGYYLTMVPFALVAALWLVAEISSARQSPVVALEFVGRACFSIYLMHIVMAAVISRMGISEPFITTVLSLIMIAPFYLVVERPSHILARYLGKQTLFLRAQFKR